jgi:formate dehydrogenase subunit delta
MNSHHLVKMINEISAFWQAEAGPENAATAVATHLRRYWDPRMRREIIAHYRGGAGGLCDIARDAVALLAEHVPEAKTSPPPAG